MSSVPGTLEELVADLEGCAIRDFFNQNLVDNPLGVWGIHGNHNQASHTAAVSPVVLPEGLATELSPLNDFIEHRSVLNDVISSMINTRLSFCVEAYLACLQAVHGEQLTVGQAISILRDRPPLANPHNGNAASPSFPSVPPVEAAPVSPGYAMMESGTSAGIPTEALAELETESDLGAYDIKSLRRIFSDGDRVRVECLWPKCGRTMMKDNHPRHIRECHLRAKRVLRGVTRKNNSFYNSFG